MSELIYREVVAIAGFDPGEDVREPWSLTDAKQRLQLSEKGDCSADTADERRLLEAFVAESRSCEPVG